MEVTRTFPHARANTSFSLIHRSSLCFLAWLHSSNYLSFMRLPASSANLPVLQQNHYTFGEEKNRCRHRQTALPPSVGAMHLHGCSPWAWLTSSPPLTVFIWLLVCFFTSGPQNQVDFVICTSLSLCALKQARGCRPLTTSTDLKALQNCCCQAAFLQCCTVAPKGTFSS